MTHTATRTAIEVDAPVAGAEEGAGASHGTTFVGKCATWHTGRRAWA